MKIFLLAILLFVNSAYAEEKMDLKADYKKAEKIVKRLGIDLSKVKIGKPEDLGDMGGFVFRIEIQKPIKFMNNNLPIGSDLVYRYGGIKTVNLRQENQKFLINGLACTRTVGLVHEKLCLCDIVESAKFGIHTIQPPARISFDIKNGKPILLFKETSWNYEGNEYKMGSFELDKNGDIVQINSDDGDRARTAYCTPDEP